MQNPNDEIRFTGQRERLVRELERKGITDVSVLNAINKVPRHKFFRPDLLSFAYYDNAYPIGAGQTISQPYTVAYQTALLKVDKGLKVLEIGTGSGYQAAVLCEMGATVYSIERQKSLYSVTPVLLKRLGYYPKLVYGDGFEGIPEEAPFDRILITAAAPEVPQKLLKQLNVGGLMVVPVGGEPQIMMRITRISDTDFEMEKFGVFTFVPMLKGVE
ncbi:protein-L-isoaspartate(D-aspartate) O-methyltransferase [Saccharicrinis sp. FJH2]|uniref:protein-L-isoaspartate(D-aspartate) O-methyltransferase n=1 Tax=Saccharicrinis sp. FJH65 TaxID=3344659 RepID=UPI0035F26364